MRLTTKGGVSAACAVAHVLVACADPAAEQSKCDREAAQFNVIADAMFWRACLKRTTQYAGDCRKMREDYERELAAFKAKYGEKGRPLGD